MKFEDFVKKTRHLPLIESEIFLAGESNTAGLKVQFSRWVSSGRLVQLRRGVYMLPEHYRERTQNAFYAANILKKPSYISLEKALEFYGLIPEAVKVYTSVTSKRAGNFRNEVGVFDYRHISVNLFWGYQALKIDGRDVFLASPEKALLDFLYFNSSKISDSFLEGLRLQNTDVINADQLMADARRFGKPVMLRRAKLAVKYIRTLKEGERIL